jgi:hypothetical protein
MTENRFTIVFRRGSPPALAQQFAEEIRRLNPDAKTEVIKTEVIKHAQFNDDISTEIIVQSKFTLQLATFIFDFLRRQPLKNIAIYTDTVRLDAGRHLDLSAIEGFLRDALPGDPTVDPPKPRKRR